MIVTIDGPAGAGKSSVARELAERIGFHFLDTGAMYRSVTWLALQRDINLSHGDVVTLTQNIDIQFSNGIVKVDGEDVSDAIRGSDVTRGVSEIADNPAVREQMVDLQRKIVERGDFVCEGRDQGTVAFPKAACKFFLTASPVERARRRYLQLENAGVAADFDDILSLQNERDRRDTTRPVGNLVKASDAIEVSTDGKSFSQVVEELQAIVSARINK